jgi:hypothetical protein
VVAIMSLKKEVINYLNSARTHTHDTQRIDNLIASVEKKSITNSDNHFEKIGLFIGLLHADMSDVKKADNADPSNLLRLYNSQKTIRAKEPSRKQSNRP